MTDVIAVEGDDWKSKLPTSSYNDLQAVDNRVTILEKITNGGE